MYSLQCTVYSVHYILYIDQNKVYSVNCTYPSVKYNICSLCQTLGWSVWKGLWKTEGECEGSQWILQRQAQGRTNHQCLEAGGFPDKNLRESPDGSVRAVLTQYFKDFLHNFKSCSWFESIISYLATIGRGVVLNDFFGNWFFFENLACSIPGIRYKSPYWIFMINTSADKSAVAR